MCGILGEFRFDGKDLELASFLGRLETLAHRGPDGYGCEFGDVASGRHARFFSRADKGPVPGAAGGTSYALGHRRLSILDLNDNAFQPMASPDGRYTVVFNGEIYNYVELRQELLAAGARFQTDHSDTEVLLNAYIRWGPRCLGRFRGMFAFAILDRTRRTVFLARDRIGKKPLYYHLSPDRFAFSSELGPLLAGSALRWRIDPEALCFYMDFGYVPHPRTIFQGLRKLPPAASATVDLDTRSIDVAEYWDVRVQDDARRSPDQFLEEVDAVLTEAVSIRLRSDVPLAAFISGGTDSTLVVKKIHDVSRQSCDIFGADFPQPEQSEGAFIKAVAERYSQQLHLIPIDIRHAERIADIIKVFDEPFDGGSSIALYELFGKVASSFKVILTGDGGDELFAGYPRYWEFQPSPLRTAWSAIAGRPAKFLAACLGAAAIDRRADRWIHSARGDFWERYLLAGGGLDLGGLVLERGSYRAGHAEVFESVRKKVPRPHCSPVKSLQYLELKTILPGRMLYKLDRFSMRYGVEARSPLLDHRLAELAFEIPSRFSISKKGTKLLLKKLLAHDFPPAFVHRQKHGFGNPLSHWFSAPGAPRLFEVLNNRESLIYSYLDHDRLHARFPQIKRGYTGTDEKTLWRLLVLGHFLENSRSHLGG